MNLNTLNLIVSFKNYFLGRPPAALFIGFCGNLHDVLATEDEGISKLKRWT